MIRFVRRGEPMPPEDALPVMQDCLEKLLYARGARTAAQIEAFLHPAFSQLNPPEQLPGVEKAVALIRQAALDKKKAVVYGDYDVDGVCASVIMTETLRAAGLLCEPYIPDRHEEGYGLNSAAVAQLCREGYTLLVTVDCGITSVQEVAQAKENGMTVILTDHHTVGKQLPEADAIVSPQLDGYPFAFLCGAATAWKVSQALMGKPFAETLLDLCALATVADLMPLLNENRILVTLGLDCISNTKRVGLNALKKVAGIEGNVKSDQVAFGLAPRLNAAGRLDSAMEAYALLTERDASRAMQRAMRLESLNQARKTEEKRVLDEAEEQIKKMDLTSLRALVLCGEDWDSGVVGLAAGRIAEKYAYPTVALTRREDTYVGSARSCAGVNLYEALCDCGDIFLRFGGHSQAAGMTLKQENIPLLRDRLSASVEKQLCGRVPEREIYYDEELSLSSVSLNMVGMLEMLEPFGTGNPAPQFLIRHAEGVVLRAVGAHGAHLKCTFRQGDSMRDGIYFGGGDIADQPKGLFSLIAVLQRNSFQGRESVQCQVKAMRIEADTLPEERKREHRALLQDLRQAVENNIQVSPHGDAAPISDAELSEMASAGQGTLLFCRRGATAKRMSAQYPQLELLLKTASSARADSGIALYCPLAGISPFFKRIVLCDGVAGEWEWAAFKKYCPQARICFLQGEGARQMQKALALSMDEMRGVYRALRSGDGDNGLAVLSEALSMEEEKLLCALDILSEIALIRFSDAPYRLELLPMVKKSPMDSKLLQLFQT